MVTPEQISLPDTGGVADLAERDKKQEKLSRNNSQKKGLKTRREEAPSSWYLRQYVFHVKYTTASLAVFESLCLVEFFFSC